MMPNLTEIEFVKPDPDGNTDKGPAPISIMQRNRHGSDPDSEPNTDALRRILEKVFVPMLNEGSIEVAARILQKTETYGSTRELLEELDFLDEWEITFRDSGSVTKQDTGMTQFLLIQRFLESIIDREGWYTAKWFKDQYGLEPSRLRQAVHRGKLSNRREKTDSGETVIYSYEAVRRLWPEEITH